MRPSTSPFSFAPRHGTGSEGFEWEELPSLIHRVVPRPEPQRAARRPWTPEPMDFAPAPSMSESIPRPRVRALEVSDSEMQRLFFDEDLLVNPLSPRTAAPRRSLPVPRSPEDDLPR